jgi:hypothetical protein
LNLPGQEQKRGGFADRAMGTEAGRPPDPQNTREFPQDGSLPEGADAMNPNEEVPNGSQA